MTQAPSFASVKAGIPLMQANISAGEQLNQLTVYFMAFGYWEAHLKLYAEAKYMRETDYHLYFIEGLATQLKNQVIQEKYDRSFKETTDQVFQEQSSLTASCKRDLQVFVSQSNASHNYA
jgi:hypothetical protein